MNILITGGNGYIGRHVAEYAKQFGKVTVSDIQPLSKNQNSFLKLDLLKSCEDKNLYKILGEPDCIIHLAWRNGFDHKAKSHLEDLPYHYSFLKNMIDSGCKSISIMGSMHEIGYFYGEVRNDTPCNPLSLYGIAKNALRQAVMTYCEGKDVSLKWLRAFYVTGDDRNNNSVFSKILKLSEEGKKTFPFTSGLNKYDFLDINLLAKYVVKAAIQTKIEGIINLCSGEPVSLKEKVKDFILKNSLDIEPVYGAFPSRNYDSPAIWGDSTLIKKIIEE